jgi:hypothetical protein
VIGDLLLAFCIWVGWDAFWFGGIMSGFMSRLVLMCWRDGVSGLGMFLPRVCRLYGVVWSLGLLGCVGCQVCLHPVGYASVREIG